MWGGHKRGDIFEGEEEWEEEQFIEGKDGKDKFIISSEAAKNHIKKIPTTSVSHADLTSKL